MKSRMYFTVFFLALGLFAIAESLTFKRIESIFVPLLTSSIISVLMAVELVKIFWQEKKAEGAEEAAIRPFLRSEARQLLIMLVWLTCFTLTMYLFGALLAVPLFVCVYLKSKGNGWLLSILAPLVLTVAIYLVFDSLLQVRLSQGVISDKLIHLLAF